MKTSFVLNGEKRTFDFESHQTLADALRGTCGLKSLKCGCERGDCGSCTIFLNGSTVKSCLVLAVEADGGEVLTLERLMGDGINRIQRKFLEKNSFQCGFCAPGMIVATEELLEKNPKPTYHEVQEALSGNLCRCTGYSPIIDAIMELAEEN